VDKISENASDNKLKTSFIDRYCMIKHILMTKTYFYISDVLYK